MSATIHARPNPVANWSRHRRTAVLVVSAITLVVGMLGQPPSVAQSGIDCQIHVSATPGATPDGTSWGTAFGTLQQALDRAAGTPEVDRICLTAGRFRPTATLRADQRSATFSLADVHLYGGFAADGSDRGAEGDVTVLSGDIGIPVTHGDNAYHVVIASGGEVVLDDVDIVAGRADSIRRRDDQHGGGLWVRSGRVRLRDTALRSNSALFDGGAILVRCGADQPDCDLIVERSTIGVVGAENTAERGAGIAAFGDHVVTIDRTRILGNTARTFGGGVYSEAPIQLINSILSTNTAFDGAAMHLGRDFRLAHVTASLNRASRAGGGLYVAQVDPADDQRQVLNSVLWANAGDSLSLQSPSLQPDVVGSVVAPSAPDEPQDEDAPRFVDLEEGFDVSSVSPAVDIAEPLVLSGYGPVDTDIDGNPRPVAIADNEMGGRVDAGAIENTNEAPVAVEDEAPTDEGGPFRVGAGGTTTLAAPGLLANDTDADTDPLTAVLLGPDVAVDDTTGIQTAQTPAGGTVRLNPDGSFVYTADPAASGADSFTYAATDGFLRSNPVTIQIEVEGLPVDPTPTPTPTTVPPPGGPTGPVSPAEDPVAVHAATDVAATTVGRTVQIDLIGNDRLGDGRAVRDLAVDDIGVAVTRPRNGTVQVTPDGIATYTPNPGVVGIDRFDYTVRTADAQDTAPVIVAVGASTIAQVVEGDTTVTTDRNGPSAAGPLVVSVTVPVTVPVVAVVDDRNPGAQDGQGPLGVSVDIDLPTQPASSPYLVQLALHQSIVPSGPVTLAVQGPSGPLPPCADPDRADPDPCLLTVTTTSGTTVLEVMTTQGGRFTPVAPLTSRVSGEDRIRTAVALSRSTFPSAPRAVIARAGDFADALAGGPLAHRLDGPLLLTDPDGLHPATAAELQRLGVEEVVLLGGDAALSRQVVDDLVALGLQVRRIGGATRFDTAARIGREVGGSTAYVVLGSHPDPSRAWPDAVSVAALAAREGAPLALVTADELPAPTREMLLDGGVDAVTIVGGDGAVSGDVERALMDLGLSVGRLAGPTRFDTSAAVADRMLAGLNGTVVTWLASGRHFPDALAAGPAVAAAGGILLLSDTGPTAQAPGTGGWIEAAGDRIRHVVLVGGPSALPAAVEANVVDTLGGGGGGKSTTRQATGPTAPPACTPHHPMVPSDTTVDTDGDGISDFLEVTRWRTSPTSADTDGDGLSDTTEIYDLGFNPQVRPDRFNPLVADVAELAIEVTSPATLELITEEGTSVGNETVEGYSSSTTTGVTDETTRSYEWEGGFSVGGEFGQEISTGTNGLDFKHIWKVQASVNFSFTNSTSTSHSVSREVSEELSRQESTSREETSNATGGIMAVTVDVVNDGHVSVQLSGLALDVVQQVGEEFVPVITLRPEDQGNAFPQRTLAPGQRLEDLIFATEDMTVESTRALLRDPSGLVFRTSNHEFTVLHTTPDGPRPIASGFLQQSIDANTAQVVIDRGNGLIREHAVAVTATRDPATGLPTGLPLCAALLDVLRVPLTLDDRGRITRMDGLDVVTGERRTWITVLEEEGEEPLPQGSRLGDIVLNAGDVVTFAYLSDVAGDGILERNETALGLEDGEFDVDEDTISTAHEVGLVRTVSVLGRPPFETTSSALLPDSDLDGLSDAEEIRQGTDPRNHDTDGDGLGDGFTLTSSSSPTGRLLIGERDREDWQTVCPVNENFALDGCDPLNPDTNGDGISDGGISAPFTDLLGDLLVVGGPQPEALHLIPGTPDGFGLPRPLADASIRGDANILTRLPDGAASAKVAHGDINGDGREDLVIATRGESVAMATCVNPDVFAGGDRDGLRDETGRAYPRCGDDAISVRTQDVSRHAELRLYLGSPGGYRQQVDPDTMLPVEPLLFPMATTPETWDDARLVFGGDLDQDGRDDLVLLKHSFQVLGLANLAEPQEDADGTLWWYRPGRAPANPDLMPEPDPGINESCVRALPSRFPNTVAVIGLAGNPDVASNEQFGLHPNLSFPRFNNQAGTIYDGYVLFGDADPDNGIASLRASLDFQADKCPWFQDGHAGATDGRTPNFQLTAGMVDARWGRGDSPVSGAAPPITARTPRGLVTIGNVAPDPGAGTSQVLRDELLLIGSPTTNGTPGDPPDHPVATLVHTGGFAMAPLNGIPALTDPRPGLEVGRAVTADIDGNGRDELMVLGADGSGLVYPPAASGGFGSTPIRAFDAGETLTGQGSNPVVTALGSGDVNADGIDDLGFLIVGGNRGWVTTLFGGSPAPLTLGHAAVGVDPAPAFVQARMRLLDAGAD